MSGLLHQSMQKPGGRAWQGPVAAVASFAIVMLLVAGGLRSRMSEEYLTIGILSAGNTELQTAVPEGRNDSYVAVCLAVKDEHCDIREFLLYHASMGIEKFYIVDTGSAEPVGVVMDDMIASGLVEYIYLNASRDDNVIKAEPPTVGEGVDWQRPIYKHCLAQYGERHRWMAFIDMDEFILLDGDQGQDPRALPKFLQQYERHPGVVLHWQMYAASGHFLRPPGGVLQSYTQCCPRQFWQHGRVKVIVQPALTVRPRTVHDFLYREGHAVNTEHKRFDVPALKRGEEHLITYQGARLVHYVSKSLEDFAAKLEKKGANGAARTLTQFLQWSRCTEECSAAVPLGRQLAARFDLQRGVPARCRPHRGAAK